ncbi:MAG: ABC transporter permease, partial [Mobilitalea sp.]
GEGYKTGDHINLVYNDSTYTFEVYGFTEDVMFSTPTNMSAQKCFISTEAFDEISEQAAYLGQFYRLDLTTGGDTEEFENRMNQVLGNEIPDFEYAVNWATNYAVMKYGAGITASIIMGILTVFSSLLIIISLIIVHFNISNSIEMNMKNIGMLKASGYTSSQMTIATILEFMMISIFAVCAGLICAISAANVVGTILSSSIGLLWEMNFDVTSALISIFVIMLLVLLAVLLCSLKFKRITPLDALRNGINSHNFKKNRIQLAKIALPINTAIGMKSIFFHKKKNLIICFIIVILSFCANEAISVYQNFAIRSDKLVAIAGIEQPDILIKMKDNENSNYIDNFERTKQKVLANNGVQYVIECNSVNIICKANGEEVSVNLDVYDRTDKLRTDTIVRGRRPTYDNEIMLTSIMAEHLNVSIGDVVYLELNGKSTDYLLVGESQGLNQLGRTGMMTKDGLTRINPDSRSFGLYIYAVENSNLNNLLQELKVSLTEEQVDIANYVNYIATSLGSIATAMKLLCGVMIGVVILTIALILVLIIKIQLVRDQKQLGIYKALGYTTGQLMLQTIMSYIPIVFLGSILGSILAWFGVEPSFILCLSAFGIEKSGMDVSFAAMIGVVITIVLWATLIAGLCSIRIKKIVPWKMMQEV